MFILIMQKNYERAYHTAEKKSIKKPGVSFLLDTSGINSSPNTYAAANNFCISVGPGSSAKFRGYGSFNTILEPSGNTTLSITAEQASDTPKNFARLSGTAHSNAVIPSRCDTAVTSESSLGRWKPSNSLENRLFIKDRTASKKRPRANFVLLFSDIIIKNPPFLL